MKEPYIYILNKKIKNIYLEELGFELKQGSYHYKKMLNKFIYVEIEIDLEEKWLVYFVKVKDIDEYYTPFYLSEYRIHNSFYDRVVYSFNQYMDFLCRKNILWRPGIIKKPESSRRKEHGYIRTHNSDFHSPHSFNVGMYKSKRHPQNKNRARTG